jgi:hypothetical protein
LRVGDEWLLILLQAGVALKALRQEGGHLAFGDLK